MRILVTGGAGFIGSNFVRYTLLHHPDDTLVNCDALTYAGNLESLQDIQQHPHYQFVHGDIRDGQKLSEIVQKHGIEAIVHFAAESHVDRSIHEPAAFVETNVLGTQVLLDVARQARIQKFVHVSTDEVYGTLGSTGYFTEETPLSPNSPYSASKAGSDLLVRAYHETYGLNVNITRCSNNYGPYQFPEKLIPLMILNALENKPLPVYGTGENVRDWLHVEDHCRAVDLVLRSGVPGRVYNIGGHNERRNIDVVREILRVLGKPESLIQFVTDRPGHDLRYAIDPTRIEQELGWKPNHTFETGLRETVEWYVTHQEWCKRVKSGEYQRFYALQYGGDAS
ncbi:dTDP-glucose 4,6-dehydratase [Alicyclobacillus tolerans]|uniref:dTDP-glucose 4,6-dehydratase n=1 Tax=Alicyclobacillus tolerans TaxID=90970 RepID=A0ABT9LV76_9BACL|nr:dTDP-glucose 4,6-dehydratase [Alicyclobacillus tengchongensis]MDP9728091.1 dTDP-glucose 4,6-dehydratase [Alicyclobacillus tengchongensis]